jgi:hypothetical protein
VTLSDLKTPLSSSIPTAAPSKRQLRKERFERIQAQGINFADAWQIKDSGGMPVWQMYSGNKYQRGSAG